MSCARTVIAGFVVALLLTAVGGGRSFADEPSVQDDQAQAGQVQDDSAKGDDPAKEKVEAPEVKQKEAKPGSPSLLDQLSKELFKELDEDPAKAAASEKENKLDRVAKGMRNAGEKLDGEETGETTRKIQQQVIKDLEDLINQLQNPPPQGGGGGGGGATSKSMSGQLQQLQKSGQSSKSRSQQASAGPGAEVKKPGGKEKEKAEGSEERSDAERKAAEEAARKKKLDMDVWGHLPPHLREKLLNTYGERTLPKYQQLVKQFYESLSEQGSSSPRR